MGEIDLTEKNIGDLIRQKAELEAKILAETIKLAREKGLAFESIEELVARHPNAQIIKDGLIGESFSWKYPGQHLATYALKGVKMNVKDKEVDVDGAYDCDNCGIVLGNYLSRKYDDHGPLCGSKGEEFSCRICGSSLGRHAWIHY
jgi:hypothetical protein